MDTPPRKQIVKKNGLGFITSITDLGKPHPDLVLFPEKLGILQRKPKMTALAYRTAPFESKVGVLGFEGRSSLLKLPRFPRGNRLRWVRRFLKDWEVTLEPPTTLTEALYEFTQTTTFHGIRFIFDIDNLFPRRLIWSALIIIFGYLFLQTLTGRFEYFASNPTADNREIIYVDSLEFPALTICNHNLFRTSKAAEKNLYDAVSTLFAPENSNRKHMLDNNTLLMLKESLQYNLNITEIVGEIDHQKHDLIFKCTWQGEECFPDNFTTWITDMGLCFTFNGDKKKIRKSYNSGPLYGLKLVLNIEQYEYMAGPYNTAGIKAVIHNQTEVIDINDRGLDVPPAMSANVGIQVIKLSNDRPGKECAGTELRYWTISYAALSHYNAEKILEETPEKISEIKERLLKALEMTSENSEEQLMKDKEMFDRLETIYQELGFLLMVPDRKALLKLKANIYNYTCFSNARDIVLSYFDLSRKAVAKLKTLKVLNSKTSLYLTNFVQFMFEMRVEIKNFDRAFRKNSGSFGSNSKERRKTFDAEVRHARTRQMGLVTEISEEIHIVHKNIIQFTQMNNYLLNLTDYVPFLAGLSTFTEESTDCMHELNMTIQSQLDLLLDVIYSGADPDYVTDALKILVQQTKLCEDIFTNNAHYNRDDWARFYDRLVVDVSDQTEEKFKTFNATLLTLDDWDFQENSSSTVFDTLMSTRKRSLSGEITKLGLAEYLSDESFQERINYLLNFLSNVENYLYKSLDIINGYLNEFETLNQEVPEVVRQLYKKEDVVNFKLYFEGNLFDKFEVKSCKSRIGTLINNQTAEVASRNRKMFFAWRQLRDELVIYKKKSLLDQDFVLENFAQLSVYFRELRYESVSKQNAYELSALISDLGGNTGLYFGGSLLTIAEVFDVFLYTLYKKWRYKHLMEQREEELRDLQDPNMALQT